MKFRDFEKEWEKRESELAAKVTPEFCELLFELVCHNGWDNDFIETQRFVGAVFGMIDLPEPEFFAHTDFCDADGCKKMAGKTPFVVHHNNSILHFCDEHYEEYQVQNSCKSNQTA